MPTRARLRNQHVGLLGTGDHLQSGVEACCVSGGKELLGVGAFAAATHFLGNGEAEIERPSEVRA